MQLTHVPHPVLAKQCAPLTPADLKAGVHAALIKEMKKDMVANNGIGLAANQVGLDLALFVIDEALAAENNVPSAFANPEITEYGKEADEIEEGCLSIPGTWLTIRRAKKIMFKGLDEHGNKVKFRARGMLARVLQHETDHLFGLTIKDRATKKSRSS
ncbi:MAG: peptide deformylase [Candidatus Yanofskybacteria bacterium]|nr:peptide deformylase [Candidatus Yanofskybacteria bacterium]